MTVLRREDLGPIAYARCCRTWPVFLLWPLGRCKRCGTRPDPVFNDDGNRVIDPWP